MNALPSGWCQIDLEDIGHLFCGQSPSVDEVNTSNIGTAYVTGPDHWDGNTLHLTKWTTNPKRTVPAGCIFITVKGAGVGTLFPGVACAIGRDVYAYKPSNLASKEYILWALKNNIGDVVRKAQGDIPGLSKTHILGHGISFPPLSEQRRIVAKIEALMARRGKAREALEQIPALLERYQQALLFQASVGDLTAAWRATSAGHLWEEVSVEAVTELIFDGPFGSHLKSDDYTDDGVRVVRLENIGHLRFNSELKTYISREKYSSLRRHTLLPGDVLFSSFVDEKVRTCVWPGLASEEAINKADCFCLRVNQEICRPDFLAYRLACHSTFMALRETVHGATRPRINLGQLRNFKIKLPSLPEQDEIVRKIQVGLQHLLALESLAGAIEISMESLVGSILAKTFRGELVPQDPADEPAEALLARIRAERESEVPSSKKPRIAHSTAPTASKRLSKGSRA